MKIKNMNTYEFLMENLYYNLNEINKTIYNILLEENFDICNEMCNDLKKSLIESFKNLENYIPNNQNEYIYKNINDIHNALFKVNESNMVESLQKLYESINSNSKSLYIEFEYNNDLKNIYENYISTYQKILIVSNDLYKKEYMYLTEQINIDFNVIYNRNLEYLTEGLIGKISEFLGKVKNSFGNKHNKILDRDKKWLSSNKKKILNMDFSNLQLEVVSDYNITFEGLMQRHNIFDKNFINSSNKDKLPDLLKRFEDKKGDIKNGLDNYFRTGNSKREIGLRKVSGDDARTAVENMLDYCENFLAGKKFLDEKIDNIMKSLSDLGVTESINYSMLFGYDFNPYRLITLESSDVQFDDDNDGKMDKNENKNKNVDDFDEEDLDMEEENDEKDNVEKVKENNRGIRDRQVGLTVLLTITEERYFDYIKILKGLIQE